MVDGSWLRTFSCSNGKGISPRRSPHIMGYVSRPPPVDERWSLFAVALGGAGAFRLSTWSHIVLWEFCDGRT